MTFVVIVDRGYDGYTYHVVAGHMELLERLNREDIEDVTVFEVTHELSRSQLQSIIKGEEERQENIARRTALAKLTDHEKTLLGLN